jgi:magnesium chelatase subunit D
VSGRSFGFSAVVGHDDLKLALLLAAIDPGIGGVLLRGDKGSGKTTLARGLAALLPGSAPFVELPLGATEDRVLGSIDLAAALTTGQEHVRRGLLADADGGVLYVDEVNLLADHLVDTLLDVAVSGEHRLERDGVSVVQPARFVLVGTMNPEEGELRPQLLDRFGLCVTVMTPHDPAVRAEIVRRRLAFDRAPARSPGEATDPADVALRDRLAGTAPAAVDDEAVAFATHLALAVGAEGVRADLVLCRAAAALAGWEGRPAADVADVERVAPLALAHRRRRSPFDPPVLPPDELAEALDDARRSADLPAHSGSGGAAESPRSGGADPGPRPPAPPEAPTSEADARPDAESPRSGGADPGPRPPAPPEAPTSDVAWGPERTAPGLPTAAGRAAAPGPAGRRAAGRSVGATGPAGRHVRDEAFVPGGGRPVAATASIRSYAQRRAADPGARPEPGDLRASVREDKPGTLVVIALDTSGSMGARQRVEAATGAVLGLLTDAYQRRDRVAVVTFDGGGARVALAPTSSVEVARTRLADLHTGGTTPLAAGLRTALDLAVRQPGADARAHAVVVVVTDGRATGPAEGDPVDEALAAGRAIRAAGVAALVLDAETGTPRLGLAARLADAMAAPCRPLATLPEALHTLTAAAP